MAEALRLFRRGELAAAAQKYQELIEKADLPDAYAGLTRVYLKQQRVQDAYDIASKGLTLTASASVRVALGEVYFRQGNIPEAEQVWLKVVNSGSANARAYLGLARVWEAIALHRQAKRMIDKAYALDPGDPDIRRHWISTLTRSERIQQLEAYLAGENNDDAEGRADLARYLEYLQARQKEPQRNCRLVGNPASMETNLERILVGSHRHMAYGLAVKLNTEKARLYLDTGAGGILIHRRLAEKAGITRLSESRIRGIGDKGDSGGYVGFVQSIKIGQLEFQDCPVRVLEQHSVMGGDGLIGTDVFEDFLVEIDFPNEKLRLSELPKRPDDTTRTLSLQTEGGPQDSPEGKPQGAAASGTATKSAAPAYSGLQDRYVAPEMSSYTQVFRFGHNLLVPTLIGNTNAKLFLLDTGAFNNQVTPKVAAEVTNVREDSHTTVKGLSGSVRNVYSADRIVLQFGHLRQENQEILAFDLSSISKEMGTEVSGTLGFHMLHLLDIKIDYRDGLVDFTYNAAR